MLRKGANTGSFWRLPSKVPVILSNPYCTPRSFTSGLLAQDSQVGSWDPYLEAPSFQVLNQVWPRKVQLVSTDCSDLDDTVPLESLGGSNNKSSAVAMSPPSPKNEAERSLRGQDVDIRNMVDDLNPALITRDSAPAMNNELKSIGEAKDKYRRDVGKYLADFAEDISGPEKAQWEVDKKNLVDYVMKHKFDVLAKVGQVNPPPTPMTEFEQETIKLQRLQISLHERSVEAKKEETLAAALPLMGSLLDKCVELDEELESVTIVDLSTGDDHFVTRTMLKLGDWKSKMAVIDSLYQEFQFKTAVHKLPDHDQNGVSGAVTRTKASQ